MVSFLNRKCGCRCGWGGRLCLSVDEMRDYVLFCFSLQNEYFFHLLSQVLKLHHWELFCFLLGFFEEEGVFSTQLQTASLLNSILNSTQQPRCCLCINYETLYVWIFSKRLIDIIAWNSSDQSRPIVNLDQPESTPDLWREIIKTQEKNFYTWPMKWIGKGEGTAENHNSW